ncbi:MAG: protein-ribulosamine 3-kinase [Polaribacter sp.]|jgi:protein-ribulosamine 3-kinase
MQIDSSSKILEIEKLLGEKTKRLQSVTGGDISDAYLLSTDKENYFLKINESALATALFEAEAKGLQLIGQHCHCPEVIHHGPFQNSPGAFLILPYIQSGNKDKQFWVSLGQSLAQLHRVSATQFGLAHDNFIGRLPQSNNHHDNWAAFYAQQRLFPQVKMAFDNKMLSKEDTRSFDRLYSKLNNLCPSEKSALIHGDLWSGNFMVNKNQLPVFIDPSVSYSHREMDLAMSLLFGGFDPQFYHSYIGSYPLEPGFEARVALYQLYYLLVHVNLFGGSYVNGVKQALSKYI